MSTTPTTTYEVVESHPITGENPAHTVTVGRSPAGIHLVLSEAAADVLAGVLVRYNALRREDFVHGVPVSTLAEIVGSDHMLWNHTAIDILTARAMNLHLDNVETVYATGGVL